MADMIRRDKATPVQARRADGGGVPPVAPTVVVVPGAGSAPQPAPPHAPGVTNNVIYVVAPQGASVPPPPPQEVHHHHHHHTTNVVLPPRRRLRVKGSSFLGTLGFVIGCLTCGMAFLPQVARFGGNIAIVGLSMSTLAWVGAVLLRRVGATMPFAGMVVSGAGYGLWLYNTGQAQSTYDKLRNKSPVDLPAVVIPAPPTAAVQPPVAPPPAAQPKPAAPAKKQGPSFFGLN
jgi:hypothetical protein